MIKVSIVIPIYNVEKYLRECVDSVLRQSYKDLEIILVDDGSPDRCGEICDEYARIDSRITVIHKPNGGLSDARNAGMELASGKYIYFVDSDDYILDDAIEKLVAASERYRTDILILDALNYNEKGFTPPFMESLIHKGKYPLSYGTVVLNKMFDKNDYICAISNHFYLRNFLEREKLCFVKGLLFEDLMFNGEAFLKARRVCSISEQLYMRRLRKNSIMTDKGSMKKVRSYRYMVSRFLSLYKNAPKGSPQKIALAYLISTAANMCIIMYTGVPIEDEKCAFAEIMQLKKQLEPFGFFHSKKVRIKLQLPILFRIYRNTKNRMIQFIGTVRTCF